jgi:cell division protein FtsB
MPPGAWFQPPRRILVSFLVFALAPVAALGWLGWRLMEQEHALERQRAHESLQSAADKIGATLARQLTETEERLSSLVAMPDRQIESAASELGSRLDDALIDRALNRRPTGVGSVGVGLWVPPTPPLGV